MVVFSSKERPSSHNDTRCRILYLYAAKVSFPILITVSSIASKKTSTTTCPKNSRKPAFPSSSTILAIPEHQVVSLAMTSIRSDKWKTTRTHTPTYLPYPSLSPHRSLFGAFPSQVAQSSPAQLSINDHWQ